jgi:hypothetical protein
MRAFFILKGNKMAVRSQGTEIFFVDTLTSGVPAVTKLTCPTGASGLGGARDQIDTSCLDNTDRTFLPGLGNPGQVSIPFALDPSAASHDVLFTLKEDGAVLNWMFCLSDGTADPTIDSEDDMVPPAGRSYFKFEAYISDVNIDIAGNDIVRGTLTLQRSGTVTYVSK